MKRKKDTNKEFVESVHNMFDCVMNLSWLRTFCYVFIFVLTRGAALFLWLLIYGIKRMIQLYKEIKEIKKELMEEHGFTKQDIKELRRRARKEGGDC